MKKLAITAVAAALVFAAPAFADHDHRPQAGQGARSGPAKPAAMSAATVQKMQDNVNKMQAQLERVAKAGTDEERQKATAEYLQTMREIVKLAGGAQAGHMDCPMMGHGMDHGAGHGMDHGMDHGMGHDMHHGTEHGMMGRGGMGMTGDGAPSGGSAERLQQMEKRMDMMQLMLEQMVRRPEGQQPVPAK